jgi:peptidyl-prolyl cis-trans isomerase C
MTICAKALAALLACVLVLPMVSMADGPAAELSKAKLPGQPDPLENVWQASGDTVVGTVNHVNITKDELLRHLWFQSAPAALDDLMKKRAVKMAADAAGIGITQNELEAKIKEDVSRTKSEDFAALLSKQQMTEGRYKGILLANMLLEEYVRKQVKIDAKDYDDWVKVRYIYIADSSYESDPGKREIVSAESRKRAEKVFMEAKTGGNFADLADQYSDSPENTMAGRKQGGALGWTTRNQMQFTRSFEETCFKLEAGCVSNPVRADFGWYLIKADALGKETHGRDGELNRLIVERKVRPLIESALDKILADAKLVNKLVPPHE